jgi:uncharacterized protein
VNRDIHRIPAQTFAAFAEGGGGREGALCLVRAQASKHMLLLRWVVDLAEVSGHHEASAAKHAYEQLAMVQEAQPDAAFTVISHPAVGGWARQIVDELRSRGADAASRPSWMASVAAAAALRARIPLSITVPVVNGVSTLPSLGCARATAGELCVGSDGAQIDQEQLPPDLSLSNDGWSGLRCLTATASEQRIRLLIDDLDPYRAPGMANIGDRLSASEATRWQSVLDDAWDLLVRDHATVAEELAVMIRVLTPLRPPPGGHVSATSRQTFGAIMLSPPLDASSLAVTMAHEAQHAKLSALIDIAPMTREDDGTRYYAPWRDDPRPASGLLQGAYAFLGVAGFWRQHSRLLDEEQALTEYVRWREAVRMVVDTLTSCDRLTNYGEMFVSGIDRTLCRWEAEPIPQRTLAAARRVNNEHRERWREMNGAVSSLCRPNARAEDVPAL